MSTEKKAGARVLEHSNAQSVKSWPIDAFILLRTRPAVKRTLRDTLCAAFALAALAALDGVFSAGGGVYAFSLFAAFTALSGAVACTGGKRT